MQRGKTAVRALSLLSRRHLTKFGCLRTQRRVVDPSFVRHLSLTSHVMSYGLVERGCVNSENYRVFITDSDGKPISPFHDIPLFSNEAKKECNMVVEIPRWTNHKMEIYKEGELNPIKQDIKKGKVRFVKNCFPHHGYIWNYGAMPQTWEDVEHSEPSTNTTGDNDPLDICEIGQKVHARGTIIQVKVLGVMCLVDEGETDWKIIAIDVTDPLADKLNDINDVEEYMPGFIKATREWFTIYKIPDGKPPNQFAFNGEAKNREFALNVIEETHQQWKKLVSDEPAKRGEICCKNTRVVGSPYKIDDDSAKEIVKKEPELGAPDSLPDDVDKWHYPRL